jgi:hypothetical protein
MSLSSTQTTVPGGTSSKGKYQTTISQFIKPITQFNVSTPPPTTTSAKLTPEKKIHVISKQLSLLIAHHEISTLVLCLPTNLVKIY